MKEYESIEDAVHDALELAAAVRDGDWEAAKRMAAAWLEEEQA